MLLIPAQSPRFSPALRALHRKLTELRDQAFKLQNDLRKLYSSKNLTLKVLPKIGAAAHVLSRDGVLKLEADERAHLYQKSNSTRAYVIRVRLSLRCPVVISLTHCSTGVGTALEEDGEHVREDPGIRERDDGDLDCAGMHFLSRNEVPMLRRSPRQVLDNYDRLLETADALAELDVTLSFAELAQEKQWVKPLVDTRFAPSPLPYRIQSIGSAMSMIHAVNRSRSYKDDIRQSSPLSCFRTESSRPTRLHSIIQTTNSPSRPLSTY